MNEDEIPDDEWDDAPIFEPDPPDVIKANMPPVTREWLNAAYVAIFGGPKRESVRISFDPDDFPVT